MIIPLYALNLGGGSPTPTPTGTGAYGPFLLYGLNLGSGSAPTVYATLDEAIRAYLLAGGLGLTDAYRIEIPGVLASRTPPAPPYCIISPLNETPEWNTEGITYAAWASYQITFVGQTDTQAQAIRDAAYMLFTPRKPARPPLVFDDGTLPPTGMLPGQKRSWKGPMKNGQQVWMFAFDVRFYVTRAM